MYIDVKNNNTIFRVFKEDSKNNELVWHKDKKDRIVKVIKANKWKFQRDNQLPFELYDDMTIFIPKETIHRVIKGDGELMIKIIE